MATDSQILELRNPSWPTDGPPTLAEEPANSASDNLPPSWQLALDEDQFDVSKKRGRFIVRDFDVDQDAIDLSAFGFTYDDLKSHLIAKGHHTLIDLGTLNGATWRRKIMLKHVALHELDESNFIL